MTGQRELAEALADCLRESGHDTTTLDVLDALASRGLSLTRGGGDMAALAAYEVMIDDADGEP